jgi:hypothetical protein
MKNKKIENKKLSLVKETITVLNREQFRQIYGGGGTSKPGGPPDTATYPPPGGAGGTGTGG